MGTSHRTELQLSLSPAVGVMGPMAPGLVQIPPQMMLTLWQSNSSERCLSVEIDVWLRRGKRGRSEVGRMKKMGWGKIQSGEKAWE